MSIIQNIIDEAVGFEFPDVIKAHMSSCFVIGMEMALATPEYSYAIVHLLDEEKRKLGILHADADFNPDFYKELVKHFPIERMDGE